MSHFAVMVITDGTKSIEELLQPFHEYECTGINDQYVVDVDVTKECKEEGLDYYGLEDKTVTDESLIDREGEHQYGYALIDADGNIVKAVDRTNPNKKWDWWQVGGRWSGFLKLKDGASGNLGRKGLMGACASDEPNRADVARKGDIDFDGMRDEAGKEAEKRYDRAITALGGEFIPWTAWEKMRDDIHKGNIEAARRDYGEQWQVKSIREAFKESLFLNPDQFLVSRDQYIQSARDGAVTTYAFVKDGAWVGRGEMGWFGVSIDDEDKGLWNRKFNEMLDALPDETIITIVDCHI